MSTVKTAADAWLSPRWPNPTASLKLLCFPYAGAGGAIFRTWRTALPAHIEVCPIELPGRWSRMREPPVASLSALVEQLADALTPVLGRRFALLGYSIGGLIAFETARALRRRGLHAEHLFTIARRAPQLVPAVTHPSLHGIDGTAAFIAAMHERYGGIPPQVLDNPELLELFAPPLRADMTMLETYVYADEPPLACPITAIAGKDDAATPADEVRIWQAQTSAACETAIWDGGHFFFEGSTARLQELVASKLPATPPA